MFFGMYVQLGTAYYYCSIETGVFSGVSTVITYVQEGDDSDVFLVQGEGTTCSFFETATSTGSDDTPIAAGSTTSAAGPGVAAVCTVLKQSTTTQ